MLFREMKFCCVGGKIQIRLWFVEWFG